MSVFATGRRADASSPNDVTLGSQLSILGRGLRIVGELECEGVVKVEGRFEGAVHGRTQVLVAPGGVVVGDVSAGEVIVVGRVDGDITATTRVELQPGGVVHGDVTAPRIVVHEGGEVNGRFRMERRSVAQPAAVPVQLRKTA